MSLPWSRCGNYEPHEAHPAPTIREGDCPGWTPQDQLVRTLIVSVNEYMREHYGPFLVRPVDAPAGLRLEMHPSVRRHLMVNLDLNEPGWPQARGDVNGWLPLAVKVTTDVPKDSWRLVIVTEEILLDEKTAAVARQGTL